MDIRVGSQVASLWRPSRGPPLGHPVGERQLVSMGWLASKGRLEGRWCYVCRVVYCCATGRSTVEAPRWLLEASGYKSRLTGG